eukprot:m.391720 g.391720  ORF g.391720 m.391720 type:complete len:52 (+) comp219025_c0_seq1:71-226(+)
MQVCDVVRTENSKAQGLCTMYQTHDNGHRMCKKPNSTETLPSSASSSNRAG